MAVTSGFFNSINGDRKYFASDFTRLLDGIINDGVFANIGEAFAVKAGSGNVVNVSTGKAWFNSRYVENDAILPLAADESEVVLDRYDAIVIEVDDTNGVRKGDIKMVKGTPASSPKYPTMISSESINQYPLVYIFRQAGSVGITQANIINRIGTSDCPYITGILQVQNIDKIVAQWEAQWLEWSAQWETWGFAWDQWFETETNEATNELSLFLMTTKSDFDRWFSELQAVLDGDVATELAVRVINLQEKFRILAKEGCVYDDLQDGDADVILDSDGNVIEGKTVLGGGGGGLGFSSTGDLNMSGNKILNLGTPDEERDAATKGYVDSRSVQTNIKFLSSAWVQEDEELPIYKQPVTISVGTRRSAVALQPSMSQILQMNEAEMGVLQVDNDDGVFTATLYGVAPEFDITIQAIITEVRA